MTDYMCIVYRHEANSTLVVISLKGSLDLTSLIVQNHVYLVTVFFGICTKQQPYDECRRAVCIALMTSQ
jgi:hypothetical protein